MDTLLWVGGKYLGVTGTVTGTECIGVSTGPDVLLRSSCYDALLETESNRFSCGVRFTAAPSRTKLGKPNHEQYAHPDRRSEARSKKQEVHVRGTSPVSIFQPWSVGDCRSTCGNWKLEMPLSDPRQDPIMTHNPWSNQNNARITASSPGRRMGRGSRGNFPPQYGYRRGSNLIVNASLGPSGSGILVTA
ncbi:hypothetical protein BO78DRAFT_467531 [Aspergillus sclerotiicarbonarius CBS 121057]|uniref:Uncharacterized protein n=1 Tax=Aspergillus sclerotiicarbonarius (strain CBS 121057 / IBT 28362) TaxID=1448318 RepID=A0A319EIC5_ASPSB|nr:hypothetical protein BO78DRAFT_467531 [Aspergillus sclerotiicarbonarius CBS 121057]